METTNVFSCILVILTHLGDKVKLNSVRQKCFAHEDLQALEEGTGVYPSYLTDLSTLPLLEEQLLYEGKSWTHFPSAEFTEKLAFPLF